MSPVRAVVEGGPGVDWSGLVTAARACATGTVKCNSYVGRLWHLRGQRQVSMANYWPWWACKVTHVTLHVALHALGLARCLLSPQTPAQGTHMHLTSGCHPGTCKNEQCDSGVDDSDNAASTNVLDAMMVRVFSSRPCSPPSPAAPYRSVQQHHPRPRCHRLDQRSSRLMVAPLSRHTLSSAVTTES